MTETVVATETRPLLLAGIPTTTGESLPVVFPYDGSEIARPVSMIVLRPRVAIGMSVALAALTVIVISVAGRNAYAALAWCCWRWPSAIFSRSIAQI